MMTLPVIVANRSQCCRRSLELFKGKRIVPIGCSSTEGYLSTALAAKVREAVTHLPVHEI